MSADQRNASDQHLDFLAEWYRSQCDGDWEHQHGVHIGTIDNPGWSLDVDLVGTSLAEVTIAPKTIERTDENWMFVEVKDGKFRARGGPLNLTELASAFHEFVRGTLPSQ